MRIRHLSLFNAFAGATKADSEIKHIIIDEAQDYSNTTYMLFSGLYPIAGITLLGDMNQN